MGWIDVSPDTDRWRASVTAEWNFRLHKILIIPFDVFSTVHHSIELFHLPTLMHNSLIINNMYVTLLSSRCFEH